jgi:hypothetical protein
MIPDYLILPAVILAFTTAAVLIISRDWRISILSLAIQYICVFVLVSLSWPLETAATKLVAGWMACAVMGVALLNLPGGYITANPRLISDILFRLLAVILTALIVFAGGPKIGIWLPEVTVNQVFGSLTLISLGLLHLGLTIHPIRVVFGLLTVLSGFEILYSAVESSILIAGLLAIVTLGLAIVGAYMLAASTSEKAN